MRVVLQLRSLCWVRLIRAPIYALLLCFAFSFALAASPAKKLKCRWIEQHVEDEVINISSTMKNATTPASIESAGCTCMHSPPLSPSPLDLSSSLRYLRFEDLSCSSILKIFLNLGSIFTIEGRKYSRKNIEKALHIYIQSGNYCVFWLSISTTRNHNFFLSLLTFLISKHANLIIQWRKEEEIEEQFRRLSLSSLLADTGIVEYAPPFLLFINPRAYFLKNPNQPNQLTKLFSTLHPKDSTPFYSSLFFLHTANGPFSNFMQKIHIYQHMHYSLLLHSGVKCYGAVSMHPQIQMPLQELLPPADSASVKLYSFTIHQKYITKQMHFLSLFKRLDPVHLSVSFSIWLKMMISTDDKLSLLNSLAVKDIPLSSFCSNDSSFALSSLEHAKSIFYHLFNVHKNIFSKCFLCIERIDLLFEGTCCTDASSAPSLIPDNLSKLFALSSLFFLNSINVHFHLPDSYSLDPSSGLFSLFSSSAPFAPTVSVDEVEALINPLFAEYKYSHPIRMSCKADALSGTECIYVQLRNLYNIGVYKQTLSALLVQEMCALLLQHNLLLVPSSTCTVTLHTGSQMHSLSVSSEPAVLTVYFKKSKQSLCFRKLHWVG